MSAGHFAQQLLDLSDGKVPVQPTNGLISIPSHFCKVVESIEVLKSKVFLNILRHFNDHKWLCERAILAPKNISVNAINLQIQQQLPGQAATYKSVDTVIDADHAVQYPTEFLNSLEPSGMPPYNLMLKIGAPIMLLRNLDAPRLCNGTRLCVRSLMPHAIEATILTGCAQGEDILYDEYLSFQLICHLTSSVCSFQYDLRLRCPSVKLKDNHSRWLASI